MVYIMASKSIRKEIKDLELESQIHNTHIKKQNINKNNVSIIQVKQKEQSAYFQMGDHIQTHRYTEAEENYDCTCHNETYSRSSDVPMITVDDESIFRMGESFDSYEALKARLEYHSEQSLVQYWRRDSRTVQAALMKTARPIQPGLKYYSVKYTCVHGGAKFSPRGKGQRNTMTLRLECPAHIMVRANKSGEELEVVSVCNHHNHEVSAHLYQRLPRTRRLPTQLKEEVLDFLRMQIPRRRIKNYVFCKTGKEITNKDMLNMMGFDKRMKSIPTTDRIATLNEILENFESDPDVVQRLEQKGDTICDKSNNLTKVSVTRKRKKKLDQDREPNLKLEPCEETGWNHQEQIKVCLQHEASGDDQSGNTVRYVYQEPYTGSDTAIPNDTASYIDRNVIVETIETNGHTTLPIHFTIQDDQNKTWLGNGVKFKRVALDSVANIFSRNEIIKATVIVEEGESSNGEVSEFDNSNDVILDHQQIENETIVTDAIVGNMSHGNWTNEIKTMSDIENDGNLETIESERVDNVHKSDSCYIVENNLNANVNKLKLEKKTLLNEVESLRRQKDELLLEIENIKNQCVKVITVNGSDDVRWIRETEEHVECIFVEKSIG